MTVETAGPAVTIRPASPSAVTTAMSSRTPSRVPASMVTASPRTAITRALTRESPGCAARTAARWSWAERSAREAQSAAASSAFCFSSSLTRSSPGLAAASACWAGPVTAAPAVRRAEASPRRSTAISTAAATTSRARTRKGRGRMSVLRKGRGSAAGFGHQDVLEAVELLHAPPRAERHRVQRVLRGRDRHAGRLAEPPVQAAQQRAAAGERDAGLDQVAGQFGRALVERGLDGVQDRVDRFLDGLADLARRQGDGPGQAGHQVAPAHFGGGLVLLRPGEPELHLDLLRRTL